MRAVDQVNASFGLQDIAEGVDRDCCGSTRTGWIAIRNLMACLWLSAGVAGCQQGKPEDVAVSMDQVAADLETVSKARVFFGHQSVGGNILKGVQALSAQAGVPLRIAEVPVGSAPPAGPGLFHSIVGQNQAPERKVDDFVSGLGAAAQSPYDVAVLKFCYVDLDEQSAPTAAATLFSRYDRSMADVQAQHPALAVIHATMPLMSDPPGWKTSLKRLLGRATWRDQGNQHRADYNQRVRARYPSAEILDLARIESTKADGSESSFTVDGKRIETMALEYTYDGGHLNELGQRHVAAGFLHALAEALRRTAATPAAAPPGAETAQATP